MITMYLFIFSGAYTGTVSEITEVGSPVSILPSPISATDNDEGNNADITFSLLVCTYEVQVMWTYFLFHLTFLWSSTIIWSMVPWERFCMSVIHWQLHLQWTLLWLASWTYFLFVEPGSWSHNWEKNRICDSTTSQCLLQLNSVAFYPKDISLNHNSANNSL